MEREVGYYITYAFLPSFMPKGFLRFEDFGSKILDGNLKILWKMLEPEKVRGSIMGVILDEAIDSSGPGRPGYNNLFIDQNSCKFISRWNAACGISQG